MSRLVPFDLHRALLRSGVRALPWLLLGLAGAPWVSGPVEQLGLCLSLLGLGFYLAVCDDLRRRNMTSLRLLLVPALGLAWLGLESWLAAMELGGAQAFPRLLELVRQRPWLLIGSGALAQLSLEPLWQRSSLVSWWVVSSLLLPCLFLSLHRAGLRVSLPTVTRAVPWLLGLLTVPMQLLGENWALRWLGPSSLPPLRRLPAGARRLRLLLIVGVLCLGAGRYFGDAVLLVQSVAAVVALPLLARQGSAEAAGWD